MLKKFTQAEKGWIMYDWANSAFSAIIAAIILPTFYAGLTSGNPSAGPWWGYATSIATFICAVCAPIFGTLGDYKGYKMKLFTSFVILGATATALLAFTADWQLMLVLYIVGTIGFNGSCVFYDGFLPDVTSDERMDMVSTYGYGLGYIGGSTIPLILALVLVMFGESFGVSNTLACQVSFMVTAVWWVVFTIPMWRHVKQRHFVAQEGSLMAQSFARIGRVGRKIIKNKAILFFLIAYFFYIDGVGTIIHMASIFGSAMGMGQTELIVILMVVQLVAFPCAILYGRLAQKVGSRNMILCGIATYFLVCLVALMLEPLKGMGYGPLLAGFILLAFLVGTAQGGIQALSRSFYGKLIPADSANEFFGFFDIFGKFSAVVGPAAFSVVWDATQQVSLGILPVMVMFLIGGLLFLKLPKDIQKLSTE